ncbi:Uncharacterised protein [Segatella copri]|nr:Uncharacterised protein [Segatella copri]
MDSLKNPSSISGNTVIMSILITSAKIINNAESTKNFCFFFHFNSSFLHFPFFFSLFSCLSVAILVFSYHNPIFLEKESD